jgi:cellulose synthase/poly-beta-1,6-N-acetylglucosamine synthase-like glycosyltransferase
MLLMHKISKKFPNRTMYLKSKDVIVSTEPAKTLKEFFNQRIRWASKADKYGDKSLFPVLLLVYIFNLILIVVPVIAIFDNFQFSILNSQFSILNLWLMLLGSKCIVELFFLYPVAKFFDRQKMLWLFPLMQPFHILYTIIAGWLGKFGSYNWKGRKVK